MKKLPLLLFWPSMHVPAMELSGLEYVDTASAKVRWQDFDDGWPNYFIENAHALNNRDVIFLADFSDVQQIFRQLSVIYAIPRHGVRSFKLIIPYFPGTMDRVQKHGEIVTAMTLARVLSVIPISRTGPTEIVIFDIHDLHEQFYFGDNVLVTLESLIPTMLSRPKSESDMAAYVFPDAGAYKRFRNLVVQHSRGTPIIICEKRREGKRRFVTITGGDPQGFHAWIVDDLVQGGGTLTSAGATLCSAGAETVNMLVPHMVCPNDAWKQFSTGLHNRLLVTSNSIPTTTDKIEMVDTTHIEVVCISRALMPLINSWY